MIEIGGYDRGSVENVETHVTACYNVERDKEENKQTLINTNLINVKF